MKKSHSFIVSHHHTSMEFKLRDQIEKDCQIPKLMWIKIFLSNSELLYPLYFFR